MKRTSGLERTTHLALWHSFRAVELLSELENIKDIHNSEAFKSLHYLLLKIIQRSKWFKIIWRNAKLCRYLLDCWTSYWQNVHVIFKVFSIYQKIVIYKISLRLIWDNHLKRVSVRVWYVWIEINLRLKRSRLSHRIFKEIDRICLLIIFIF